MSARIIDFPVDRVRRREEQEQSHVCREPTDWFALAKDICRPVKLCKACGFPFMKGICPVCMPE